VLGGVPSSTGSPESGLLFRRVHHQAAGPLLRTRLAATRSHSWRLSPSNHHLAIFGYEGTRPTCPLIAHFCSTFDRPLHGLRNAVFPSSDRGRCVLWRQVLTTDVERVQMGVPERMFHENRTQRVLEHRVFEDQPAVGRDRYPHRQRARPRQSSMMRSEAPPRAGNFDRAVRAREVAR